MVWDQGLENLPIWTGVWWWEFEMAAEERCLGDSPGCPG